MGVYRRRDSPYWYLWLETAPSGSQREKTAIKVGTSVSQRADSKALAEQVYHQRMAELAQKIHRLPVERPAIRFPAFAAIYARTKVVHHRGAYREHEILKTLTAAFRDHLLTQITRAVVQQWMTTRRLKVSARTVNREIDLLKSMLKEAVPTYLESSPLVGLEKLPVIIPKRHLLTPQEERKLLPKLAPDDRAILLIGLDALVRLKDILELRREDDHGKTLYIRDPKDPTQGSPYEVPVSTRLRKALNAVPVTDSPYYFPRRRQATTHEGRTMVVRSALRIACRKAGLKYGRHGGITFHWGTRRTGATRMIQRQVDIKTVQAVGHWKHPGVVLAIYTETTTQAMRDAVEVVSGHSRGRKKRA